MALPPNFLEDLRARTPLAPLIQRKTRLTKSGRNWKGCCPFHGEKSPSFYVYDDHFHCFGCGAHGDAISFVMQAEGLPFPEAVERLAAEAGMQVPKATPEAAARERKARDLYGVMEAVEAAFRRRLRMPEGAEAMAYLRRRGLSETTIDRFGLGWSGSGRGVLAAELKPDGITQDQLAEAGLIREREGGDGFSDLYFNRVIFPIRDRRGRVISFGGRILGDGQPKYVNGPETSLFSKRRNLYGLDLAREGAFRGAKVVVVEGYMDVIALHQAGFTAAVAPLGTALTPEQMEELWRLTPEPVLCFDGDAAGGRAAAKAAEAALPLLSTERTLRLATLPSGEDPDTLVTRRGAAGFTAVLDGALPLSEALYGLLTEGRPAATPEQRAALRNRLTGVAAAIPDKTLSAEYRRSLLERFFAAGRPQPGRAQSGRGGRKPLPVPRSRPAITSERTRGMQAAALLAITLRHPWLLAEVEECFASIDFGDARLGQCRDQVLTWLGEADALDSTRLMDQLAGRGMAELILGLLRDPGLPEAASAAAQPKDALDAWWHFYGLLRGEAELEEDRAVAQRAWVEATDPVAQARAQQRLIRLKMTLAALRRGELSETDDAEAADLGPAAAESGV